MMGEKIPSWIALFFPMVVGSFFGVGIFMVLFAFGMVFFKYFEEPLEAVGIILVALGIQILITANIDADKKVREDG